MSITNGKFEFSDIISLTSNNYSFLTQSTKCPISEEKLDTEESIIDPCGHTYSRAAIQQHKYSLKEGKFISDKEGKYMKCVQKEAFVLLDHLYPNPFAKILAKETKVFLQRFDIRNSHVPSAILIAKDADPIVWPYSFEYMKNPVVDSDGHTFDLDTAKRVITENGICYLCPEDNKAFLQEQLYTNHIVKKVTSRVKDLTPKDAKSIDDPQDSETWSAFCISLFTEPRGDFRSLH